MAIPKDLDNLFNAISALKSKEEVRLFLTDLCTPSELSAMADRWKAVNLLKLGVPYREIYEKSGVSTATVTRVARCLSFGSGGYRLLLDRLEFKEKKTKMAKRITKDLT
jgi:TrpR-related protein YerC/YecD